MVNRITGRAPLAGSRTTEADWPDQRYAWFVVFVLTLAYTCSFIDRQVLSLLVQPIKADLGINDTQVGLLGGLAFTIFYTALGVPLAWVADRSSRRNLMIVGLAFWSAMTAACGFAKGFWTLFAARVGVGVGEAALSPAAFSMLADYFPPQKLARAISTYSTGVYFGAGLALMIGGAVVDFAASGAPWTSSMFGALKPWQIAFVVVGALGAPIFLLMLTIREPARRTGRVEPSAALSEGPTLLSFIQSNLSTLIFVIGAFTLIGIAIGNYLFWTPSMLMRSFGWTAPKAGLFLGAVMFIVGTLGVYAGGWLADALARRGHADAILRAALIGVGCGLPFIVGAPLIGDDRWALPALAVAIFCLALPQGLPAAAFQVMTPNALRARITSIYFFIGNLIANGLGPILSGALTDFAFDDPSDLRYSLSIVCACAVPAGLAMLIAGLSPFRRSLDRAAAS